MMKIKNGISKDNVKGRRIPLYILLPLIMIILSGFSLSTSKKIWNSITHDKTNFPLTGKHRTVSCSECHKKGFLAGTPSECEVCHLYRKKDDVHNMQLGIHCGECHTPTDWKVIKPGSWSHIRETGFPLSGQHRISDCRQCHMDNIYSRIDSSCDNCHMDDYRKAKEPDHNVLGYSTDCDNCHYNSFTWDGAIIDHDKFWLLKGAHTGHDCSRCHLNGYNISSECITCHLDDYERAKEPDHRNAGFSTDCSLCHLKESFSWSQASFNHNFPVSSGKHQHLSCSDCHETTNYYDFSCIGCHEHSQLEMDNKHAGVGGYVYLSRNCYFCHPDGN